MWKMCIGLLVLTIVAASLFAQSESLTESMTEEQLEEFNRDRLTVDVGITTSAVARGFGGITMESYRNWTGRQGFERLSESQFYAIAGYPEQSEEAGKYKKTGWALLIGGGALIVGGLAWMTLGMTSLDYDDPDYSTKMNRSLFGGSALSLGGMIPFWIGRKRVQKNWSSAEQAQMVADEYNRKLAEKILLFGKSQNDQTATHSSTEFLKLFPTSFPSP